MLPIPQNHPIRNVLFKHKIILHEKRVCHQIIVITMVVAFHQLTGTFRRPTLLCFECGSIARNATELCILLHISCPWSESSSTRLTTLFPLMPIVPFAINYILLYTCFTHGRGGEIFIFLISNNIFYLKQVTYLGMVADYKLQLPLHLLGKFHHHI